MDEMCGSIGTFRSAHGTQTVQDGRLDVDEALAVLTMDGPQRGVLGQRRAGDGVVGGGGDRDADYVDGLDRLPQRGLGITVDQRAVLIARKRVAFGEEMGSARSAATQ
jgi:hypothetical protein